MSVLVLQVSGSGGVPLNEWDIDTALGVGRFVFVYSGGPAKPASTYITVDAGQAQIPDGSAISTVVPLYSVAVGDAGTTVPLVEKWRTPAGDTTAASGTLSIPDIGPDNWDNFGQTITTPPSGGWTAAKINGGAFGLQVPSNIGSAYPARIRWRVSDSGVTYCSVTVTFTLPAPTATTNAATNTSTTGAQLNGTVNPNGANSDYPVSYKFQWGLTAAYGNETTPVGGQTGSLDSVVSSALSGLVGNTTYHYRLVAYNGDNTINGADQTFVTAMADSALMML